MQKVLSWLAWGVFLGFALFFGWLILTRNNAPGATTCTELQVRVRNDSRTAFSRVILRFPGDGEEAGHTLTFDALQPSRRSDYAELCTPFRYADVTVRTATGEYTFQPDDYARATPRGSLRLTYSLLLEDDQLSVLVTR